MKVLLQKVLVLVLMVAVIFTFTPLVGGNVNAMTVQTSSKAGKNIDWKISNGTLILSGSGSTYDFDSSKRPPWYEDYSTIHDITKIKIDKGITSIGKNTFYGLYWATEVSLPSGLKKIGKGAFAATGLTAVAFPETLQQIGDYAFRDTEIVSVNIPAAVTKIGVGAFDENDGYDSKLQAINVDTANAAYSSQEGVLFNKAKTIILEYPQQKPGASYTIPSTVKTIGYGAFVHADISSVTIPNGVTKIDEYAFTGCQNLTTAIIPSTVTSLGEAVFFGCDSLTEFTVPGSIKKLPLGTFSYCENLKNVVIESGVANIDSHAFNACSSLESITIPASVRTIAWKIWWSEDETKTTPTIIGYEKSTAEIWAQDHNWKFVSIGIYNHKNPDATTISSITATKKGFTIKWKKKDYSGYQIRYSTKSSMASSKKVNISNSATVSKKITKLASKKKYYVQIRTYDCYAGKDYYSSWSKSKSVKTK